MEDLESGMCMDSALHRLLTFPRRLRKNLNLELEAIAAVGFFYNDDYDLECFRCHEIMPPYYMSNMTPREIRFSHYDCTHPRDDDIPPPQACFYNYEAHRRYSFYCKSADFELNERKWAKNGFYWTGTLFKCHYCPQEYLQDDAIIPQEHKQCPFQRNKPVGNFGLGEELVFEEQANPDRFEIRPFARPERIAGTSTPRKHVPQPVHSRMAEYDARIQTFTAWPKTQDPEDLAKAGFFYTGKEDEVLCFWCDLGLKEWEPEDEALVLHAKWYGPCEFLQKITPQGFITSVQKVHKPIMKMADFKAALEETEAAAKRLADETK